ncbi:hypothetical protein [Pseudofrankia sp. DC12]|uniref:hypothetical protein n=1 Tax=Pseudofrankia sp. DC12 TaxID=683315 RepID=UPI0005F860B2|nr:hypothetical protein [Pseudofrankia sp. DC12]
MSGIRADLARVPWWATGLLVLLAVLVLVLRVAGLAVCLVVDTAERVELAASNRAGIAPLGGSSWPLTDVPTPSGGAW